MDIGFLPYMASEFLPQDYVRSVVQEVELVVLVEPYFIISLLDGTVVRTRARARADARLALPHAALG